MSQTKFIDARREVAELVIHSRILGLLPSYHRGLLDDEVREHHYSKLRQDAELSYFGGVQYFNWEQSWGVSCSLQVDWKTVTKRKDGKDVKITVPECKVSWSSTGRDIASARAAILLYSAVTDLAIIIETHFRDRDIEDKDLEYARRSKEREEQRAAEVEAYKSGLEDGATFNWDDENDDVPLELEHGLGECRAHRSKDSGEQCGAATKTLRWSVKHQTFLARCGRHKNSGLTEHDLAAVRKEEAA